MICFVTDIRSSVEPDILTLLKGNWLEIRSLNGEVLERIGAPSGGWTHERLVEQAELLQIPFFMIKQSNDMISLIDGHDQRL